MSAIASEDPAFRKVFGGEGFLPDDSFTYKNTYVLSTCNFGPKMKLNEAKKFLRAGARKHLYFNAEEVRAAIVTCGGLCPGLNAVIRDIVMSLCLNYKVKDVYGIQFGYKGFYSYEFMKLTPEIVQDIHNKGGTIIGSSRGGFDLNKIVQSLVDNKINQLYVIGGDGTHKGVDAIYQEIKKRKLKIAVCGLPKTIDNDLPYIDKSFGFDTAVDEAQRAIKSAYVESHSAEYGVGLVRLMGRYAGFIAMMAASASRDVNVCLVPEFKFDLDGERGLLKFIGDRLKVKKHCVIVAAEGATEAIHDRLTNIKEKDKSGNIIYEDIGIILKDEISKYCKKEKIDLTLKFIDPTYMIRTVPANSSDIKLCSQLALNATHGMMAGFSNFSIGMVCNRTCFIPIGVLTSLAGQVRIQPNDRRWQRLLAGLGQPSFLNDESVLIKKEEKKEEIDCKIKEEKKKE